MKRISKSYFHWYIIKRELQTLFLVYCVAILWLIVNAISHKCVSVCVFKTITSFPCPACGTTRGMAFLFQGHVFDALKCNLNLLFIVPFAVLYPVCLLSDKLFRTHYVIHYYLRLRLLLNKKQVFLSFVLFEIMVWITHFFWL